MKNLRKRVLSLGLSVIVSAAIFVTAGVSAYAYTETTGTVSQENVKVRESASTTSTQVSSLRKGDSIDIVDEATDASGYVWYKIRVNKNEYGYVRSDLVEKKGGSSSSSASTTTSTTQSNDAAAEQLPATTATAVDAKSATITEESVNVREGAGTKYNSVGKVTKGETVTITGEATSSDNKTWYQVTFGSNGKTGYIRSDLLEVSEAAPAEGGEGEGAEGGEGEGEVTEAPEEGEGSEEESSESSVSSEAGDGHYSLVYLTDDESGEPIWYLYDNVEGYRVKVNELIEAAKSSDEVNKLVKANNNYKTILIILAVVIAALVIGLIIMALRLRDSLYYEDEEDEQEYDRYAQRRRARPDEDEEEDERPARRTRTSEERTVRPNRDEERTARPVRQPRRDEDVQDRPARPRRAADSDDERQVRPSRQPRRDDDDRPVRPRRPEADADGRRSYRDADAEAPQKEAPKRRAKNFIGDEDDFEFEFLDLDDDK